MDRYIFLISFYLMIVMTIINGNTFVAGLSFVWFPSFLLLGASMIPKRTNILTPRNLLVLLIGISAWYSTSFSDVVDLSGGFINLIFCLFSFAVISTVRYDDALARKIFSFYKLFAFIICCIMCVNFVLRYGLSVNDRVSIRYFGVTKDVNYLTAFLVPVYALYFYEAMVGNLKKQYMKCFVMLIAIFLAGSRSVFLSAIFASALIFLQNMFARRISMRRRVALVLSMIVGMVLFYLLLENNPLFSRMTTTENYESNSRLTIWTFALEAFYRNPIWGSGVKSGSFFSQQETKWVTHNSWLDILTGQGIVGSILVILLVATLFRGIPKHNRILFTAFFITCFFPLFFINGYECATFWMPMLFCKILSDKCKTNSNMLAII